MTIDPIALAAQRSLPAFPGMQLSRCTVLASNFDGQVSILWEGAVVLAPILGHFIEGESAWVLSQGTQLLVLGTAEDDRHTWTPTITATTSPNLGSDGVALGSYIILGNMCTMWQFFLFGTTGGVSGGSGTYRFEYPPGIPLDIIRKSASYMNGQIIGSGGIRDNSAAANSALVAVQAATVSGSDELRLLAPGGTIIAAAAPFTFAANDIINFTATFPISR